MKSSGPLLTKMWHLSSFQICLIWCFAFHQSSCSHCRLPLQRDPELLQWEGEMEVLWRLLRAEICMGVIAFACWRKKICWLESRSTRYYKQTHKQIIPHTRCKRAPFQTISAGTVVCLCLHVCMLILQKSKVPDILCLQGWDSVEWTLKKRCLASLCFVQHSDCVCVLEHSFFSVQGL